MAPEEYQRLRMKVGEEDEVAEILGIHALTIRRREQGKYAIGVEAEYAVRWAAQEADIKARDVPRRASQAERKKQDWARVYGSEERVMWVRDLPCAVCGEGPSENCHVYGGGMSRKANYNTIAPLCRKHHRELHNRGMLTFQDKYQVDLPAAAAATEQAWAESRPFPGEVK